MTWKCVSGCTASALPTRSKRDVAGSGYPFIIMDVEGAEDNLLDPVRVPGLRRAEVIVELHEHVVLGITERLRAARFAKSHEPRSIVLGVSSPALVGWRPNPVPGPDLHSTCACPATAAGRPRGGTALHRGRTRSSRSGPASSPPPPDPGSARIWRWSSTTAGVGRRRGNKGSSAGTVS